MASHKKIILYNAFREVKIPRCKRGILGTTSGSPVFITDEGTETYIEYCFEEDSGRMLIYTIAKKGYPINVEGCAGMNDAKPCIFYRGKES